jgi:hypothetical protein
MLAVVGKEGIKLPHLHQPVGNRMILMLLPLLQLVLVVFGKQNASAEQASPFSSLQLRGFL